MLLHNVFFMYNEMRSEYNNAKFKERQPCNIRVITVFECYKLRYEYGKSYAMSLFETEKITLSEFNLVANTLIHNYDRLLMLRCLILHKSDFRNYFTTEGSSGRSGIVWSYHS